MTDFYGRLREEINAQQSGTHDATTLRAELNRFFTGPERLFTFIPKEHAPDLQSQTFIETVLRFISSPETVTREIDFAQTEEEIAEGAQETEKDKGQGVDDKDREALAKRWGRMATSAQSNATKFLLHANKDSFIKLVRKPSKFNTISASLSRLLHPDSAAPASIFCDFLQTIGLHTERGKGLFEKHVLDLLDFVSELPVKNFLMTFVEELPRKVCKVMVIKLFQIINHELKSPKITDAAYRSTAMAAFSIIEDMLKFHLKTSAKSFFDDAECLRHLTHAISDPEASTESLHLSIQTICIIIRKSQSKLYSIPINYERPERLENHLESFGLNLCQHLIHHIQRIGELLYNSYPNINNIELCSGEPIPFTQFRSDCFEIISRTIAVNLDALNFIPAHIWGLMWRLFLRVSNVHFHEVFFNMMKKIILCDHKDTLQHIINDEVGRALLEKSRETQTSPTRSVLAPICSMIYVVSRNTETNVRALLDAHDQVWSELFIYTEMTLRSQVFDAKVSLVQAPAVIFPGQDAEKRRHHDDMGLWEIVSYYLDLQYEDDSGNDSPYQASDEIIHSDSE